jgi:hypothetical protein
MMPRCVACVNGTAWAPPPGIDIARIVVYSNEKSLIYTLLPEKNFRRFLWLQQRVLESK